MLLSTLSPSHCSFLGLSFSICEMSTLGCILLMVSFSSDRVFWELMVARGIFPLVLHTPSLEGPAPPNTLSLYLNTAWPPETQASSSPLPQTTRLQGRLWHRICLVCITGVWPWQLRTFHPHHCPVSGVKGFCPSGNFQRRDMMQGRRPGRGSCSMFQGRPQGV